ncbi:CAP domain-containing protein [Methylobacterium soli]|uniref:SCP domain-containing protein n=1 Tax=Methylobacterium soli TaxID=553447 RepID=A0A6L3SV67_9HYPH|nr:CAP domain-containing protein [Methylobacterium soli]KAB1077593.1 hypothetical protein F6X53_17830 [Methylobacterium soli]GJE46233.1 hypothetical protein AEGHOMDF_5433 [Methylobacterium soli]
MATPTNLETYFLDLINQTRASAGVKPLTFDGELLDASDAHSAWMDQTDTFSHTGVNGSSPGDRVADAGYGAQGWGENIAYVSGGMDEATIQQLHTNLVNSPGHYANIINGSFEEVGIGLKEGVIGGYNVVFVTEDFGTPNAAERAEANDVGGTATAPVSTAPAPTDPVTTAPTTSTEPVAATPTHDAAVPTPAADPVTAAPTTEPVVATPTHDAADTTPAADPVVTAPSTTTEPVAATPTHDAADTTPAADPVTTAPTTSTEPVVATPTHDAAVPTPAADPVVTAPTTTAEPVATTPTTATPTPTPSADGQTTGGNTPGNDIAYGHGHGHSFVFDKAHGGRDHGWDFSHVTEKSGWTHTDTNTHVADQGSHGCDAYLSGDVNAHTDAIQTLGVHHFGHGDFIL